MPHAFQRPNAAVRTRNRAVEAHAPKRNGGERREAGSRVGMPLFLSGTTHSGGVNFGTILDRKEENDSEVDSTESHAEEGYAGSEANATPELDIASQPAATESVGEVAPIAGEGQEFHSVAYGLALHGRTDATFSSGFRTLNTRTTQGSDCDGCTGSECVHVRGILESTFRAATQVTLPSVADFPDLTPCQRQRVRDAIRNVLAPHEQQHVAAFRGYNGTIRAPFDLTLCRTDLDARMQAMYNDTESSRQAAAQAASDALDPFEFDVDLDCEDRRSSSISEVPSDVQVASSESEDTADQAES